MKIYERDKWNICPVNQNKEKGSVVHHFTSQTLRRERRLEREGGEERERERERERKKEGEREREREREEEGERRRGRRKAKRMEESERYRGIVFFPW